MKWIILSLALVATPAFGQAWTGACDGTGGTISVVGTSPHCTTCEKNACFAFEQLGTIDSNPISVRAPTALFCLNPADDADGADTAQVWIRRCLGGSDAPAFDDNNCVRVLAAVLTGAGGSESTQNACLRTGPGTYFVEVANDGDNGDNPYVSVEAEE